MLKLIKNPEASFRYLPVIHDLKDRVDCSSTILEVGGGDFNLVNFWTRQITVLDTSFNPRVKNPLVSEVLFTGDSFPFADNSFDFIVSLDTLEHVPVENRQLFLKELARVCKKGLYLGFPCGEGAKRQDEFLLRSLMTGLGGGAFLQEHVVNGLPDDAAVAKDLEECGLRLVWAKNNFNLKAREVLMRLWLSPSFPAKVVFKFCGLLAPFYFLLSRGNCYRRIFFFEKRLL